MRRKRRLAITLDKDVMKDLEEFSKHSEISKSDIIESLLALVFKTDMVEQLYSSGSLALTLSKIIRVSAKVQAEKLSEMMKED